MDGKKRTEKRNNEAEVERLQLETELAQWKAQVEKVAEDQNKMKQEIEEYKAEIRTLQKYKKQILSIKQNQRKFYASDDFLLLSTKLNCIQIEAATE